MNTPPVSGSPQLSAPRTPPAVPGTPVLGNLPAFLRDPLGFLLHASQAYGPVVRFSLANQRMFLINDPEGIQRVLQGHNANYVKGKLFDSIRDIAGNGLFTSEGAFWLRQRRLMQPSFHRQQVASFGAMMTAATEEQLTTWAPLAAKVEPLDLLEEMTRLTLAIVTAALFGKKVRASEDITGAVPVLLDYMSYRIQVPFSAPRWVPTPRNLRVRAAERRLDQAVFGLIAARRQSGGNGHGDLLDALMGARDEETGEGMSDRQLRDEVLTLFVAGHETTALALTWCFFLLAGHPEVEQRLHQELDHVLGGRTPGAADLPSLPFTRQVIDETLRLYPPAWITNRTALDADEICGHRIPAGAHVALSPFSAQRHPEYWHEPAAFDPDRFSAERSDGRPRYAYFPFGGGPHKCIGEGFALVEAQLILATIAQRYRLRPAGDRPVELEASLTLRPRNGLRMELIPHKPV